MHLPTLSSLHIGGHYASLGEAQTNRHALHCNEICSIYSKENNFRTNHLVNERQAISFIEAAKNGNLHSIRELTPRLGQDRAELGRIAFLVAAVHGHLDVMLELQQLGFIIPSEVAVAAFQAAAREGHVNVIQNILQWRMSYWTQTWDEEPFVRALNLAARGNHVDVIRAIQSHLSNIPSYTQFTNNQWGDALVTAAEYGQVNAVLFIKDELFSRRRFADPLDAMRKSTAMQIAISKAAQGPHHDTIQALAGADQLLLGRGLIWAATHGYTDAVEYILRAKFLFETEYLVTAAIVAVRHNDINVYKEIKTALKQKDIRDFTPAERGEVLETAVVGGVVEVINDMLSDLINDTSTATNYVEIGNAVYDAGFNENDLALSTLLKFEENLKLRTPLEFLGWGLEVARESNDLDVTEFLLKDNVPSTRVLNRVLVKAATYGQLNYIQWFVMDSGIDIPIFVITGMMQRAKKAILNTDPGAYTQTRRQNMKAVYQYLHTEYHVNQTEFE